MQFTHVAGSMLFNENANHRSSVLSLYCKHWNRYQVNRVESVSGATGSALEKTRIGAMQYIKTRPNTRFKKTLVLSAILSYLTSIRPVLIGILVYLASNNSHIYPFQISVHVLKKVRGIRRSS